MAKKLLVFLTILVVCVALFVACGETPATTTTPADSESQTPTTNSSTVTTTEETPDNPNPEDTSSEEEEELTLPQQYVAENDSYWCGEIHAGVVYAERADKNNSAVRYNAFRFGYGSGNGVFGDDPDLGVPGIQLTTPDCVFIKGSNDDDYTKYEIEYYETPNWWEVWFVPKGFTPVDGESYLFSLFIKTNDSLAHAYPNSSLFWETYEDEPWTYEAPAPVESIHGDILEFVPDIKDRTQLYYHDTLTVDAEGNVKYTIKSDNSPFQDVGDIKGISMTRFGKLFINGEEYQIVADSYKTEEHYIIYFQIANFVPVADTTYEIIFTVEANDETGDYCKNLNGYFALNNYTHVATDAPAGE